MHPPEQQRLHGPITGQRRGQGSPEAMQVPHPASPRQRSPPQQSQSSVQLAPCPTQQTLPGGGAAQINPPMGAGLETNAAQDTVGSNALACGAWTAS